MKSAVIVTASATSWGFLKAPQVINFKLTNHLRSRAALVTLIFLVFSACSTNPERIAERANFSTLITENNVKRFEFRIQERHRLKLLAEQQKKNTRRRNNTKEQNIARALEKKVASIIEGNGFCRDSYLLLGRFAGKSSYRLRGECRDAATTEDIQRFPNTLTDW